VAAGGLRQEGGEGFAAVTLASKQEGSSLRAASDGNEKEITEMGFCYYCYRHGGSSYDIRDECYSWDAARGT
jgi:hypothetical protein